MWKVVQPTQHSRSTDNHHEIPPRQGEWLLVEDLFHTFLVCSRNIEYAGCFYVLFVCFSELVFRLRVRKQKSLVSRAEVV